MRLVGIIVLAIWASGLFSQPALAEKRVALVLGNSNYQNVSHLGNPANDAAKLAAIFKQANFDVVSLRTDLPRAEMRRALRDFGDEARDADIAVIYYAGHGIEVDGINYLIPIDAVLDRDADVYDEAFPLDRLLVAIEPARRLRLIILDACRDNPFAKTMKRTIAMRAVGRGLAKVEPSSPNTMIAFAAKAGLTAFDGDGKNSPFATALSDHLTTPGLDLRKAFGFVRDDVLKATSNKQEPFIYGSLGGDDVALVPAPAASPATASDPNEAVRRDYELAERVGTKEAWDFFLATYPNGFYSKLAQAQRNKLAAEEARVAATEKARAAAEEKARLEAEGAKAAEQAKAAAQAKAAEDARIAAEKNKALEETKVAAEAKATKDARIAAEKATQERIARAEEQVKGAAAKAKAAEDARATEQARVAALQKALEDAKITEAKAAEAAGGTNAAKENKTPADKPPGQLAALAPTEKADDAKPVDAPRLLLTELRRVGCYTGSIDGSWSDAAQRSLALFNKYAGTTLQTRLASLDALDVIRGRTTRVCPLVCDHGFKPDGDTCAEITCEAGYELGDDNRCRKTKTTKPVAKQENKPEEAQPTVNRPAANQSDQEFLRRCGATSCSMALRGCMRKSAILGGDSSICTFKYNNCLQTGSFVGRYCDLHGLARN